MARFSRSSIPILVYISRSGPKALTDGATPGTLTNIFNVCTERGLANLFLNNYKQPLPTEPTGGPEKVLTISVSSWKHHPNLAVSNAVPERRLQIIPFEVEFVHFEFYCLIKIHFNY